MDKELQDGGEREDTWAGEGAEALARDLLVDGETGESFPAQVLLPPTLVSSPRPPDTPGWSSSRKLALEESCVFAVDLIVFGVGSIKAQWLGTGVGRGGALDSEAPGPGNIHCRQVKCLAS